MTNISNILKAANSSLENVVKVSVLLADLKDFDAMNEVYREFFKDNFPARTTFQAVLRTGRKNRDRLHCTCKPKARSNVFVATNITLPYWQQAEAGFLDAAKAVGVKAELVGPTGYAPNAELGMFRRIVEQQPAGICLSAARPEIFQAEIHKAIAQGIPVICADADVPNLKRVLYIGTDNFKAGRESLKQMAALVPGDGSIAVITISGQRNLDDRVAGVADALKNFPAIKLTKILDDQGDARRAFDQVSELLQRKEKIDGIICLEATGGAGAARALHHFNMEGKLRIAAFDDDPETLDWIDRGAIAATITQKPYVMSYYGLKFLDDLHHNAVHQFKDWRTAPAAPMPTSVDTGTVVVDKSDLKVYREALAAHPKPL